MKFYKLNAENVRNKKEMLDKLQGKFEVLLAGGDPVFDSMYIVVIRGTKKQANDAQEVMWEFNSGAYCSVTKITEDQYDEMC